MAAYEPITEPQLKEQQYTSLSLLMWSWLRTFENPLNYFFIGSQASDRWPKHFVLRRYVHRSQEAKHFTGTVLIFGPSAQNRFDF